MSGINSRPRNWLVDKARKVVAAGNARSVILKREGRVVAEVPLTASVAGLVPAMLLAPEVTTAAVILAVLARCTVEVRRTTDDS
jgi:hypothetical protein